MSTKSPNMNDRRVQRTDQRLRDAFISLVHERGYHAVKIRDVVQRAGVGKSTFYTHFGDLEELHGRWLADFVARKRSERRPLDFTRSIFEHANEQRHVWRGLAAKKGGAAARKRFRTNLFSLVREDIRKIAPNDPARFVEGITRYLAGAFAELLFWWVDSGSALTPAEIDEIFHRLTGSALSAIRAAALKSGVQTRR